jgi:hypothetical protein
MLYKKHIAEKTTQALVLGCLIFTFADLQAQTKIQSGSWSVNQSVPGYSLDNNIGERSVTLDIHFAEPFAKKPKIILTITQLDSDKNVNLRYKPEAISISRDGFTLKVSTWADSKIFSLSGSWLAYVD